MGYEKDIDVYPGCMDVVLLFNEIGTQWRSAGMSGARVGLDYAILYRRLDDEYADKDEWKLAYADIRFLEHAALEVMAQNAESETDEDV